MTPNLRRLTCLATLLVGCAGPLPPSPNGPGHPAGQARPSQRRPSAGQVLAWADLDESLGRHTGTLGYGEADGRSILGEKVMVLNGEEMVRFVRAHGYAGHDDPVAVASSGRSLTRVHVLIRGRDGATLMLILESDGENQGRG